MDKKQLIEIINIVVEARIKKILPRILKEETEKIKKEMQEEFKMQLLSELKSSNLKSKLQTEIDLSENEDLDIPDMTNILDLQQEPIQQEEMDNSIRRKEKIFSKNPEINRIMSDMAYNKKLPAAEDSALLLEDYKKSLQAEYEDMETFSFDTKNIASIANRTAMVPQQKNASVPKEIGQEILKQQIVAQTGKPEIANAMVKDYRSLLKKVEQGAQKYRAGK